MGLEAGRAAAHLIWEQAVMAVEVVRNCDVSWSDDPSDDRTACGKVCGGGLSVCLGIVSLNVGTGNRHTPKEQMEVFLDLHGLHSNKAVEVIEDFLVVVSVCVSMVGHCQTFNHLFQLEYEHFFGLAYLLEHQLSVLCIFISIFSRNPSV